LIAYFFPLDIQVFGLHSNADISYQINTAKSILDQILAVQPKESGTTSKGETREAVVAKIAEDMLRKLPRDANLRENSLNFSVQKCYICMCEYEIFKLLVL
jgi:hypothetical protein